MLPRGNILKHVQKFQLFLKVLKQLKHACDDALRQSVREALSWSIW